MLGSCVRGLPVKCYTHGWEIRQCTGGSAQLDGVACVMPACVVTIREVPIRFPFHDEYSRTRGAPSLCGHSSPQALQGSPGFKPAVKRAAGACAAGAPVALWLVLARLMWEPANPSPVLAARAENARGLVAEAWAALTPSLLVALRVVDAGDAVDGEGRWG